MPTSAQYTFAFTDMIGRRHHCIITVISNSYESAYKQAYEQAEQFLLVPMDA